MIGSRIRIPLTQVELISNSHTLQEVLKCSAQLCAMQASISHDDDDRSQVLGEHKSEDVQTTSFVLRSGNTFSEQVDPVQVPLEDSSVHRLDRCHWRREFSFDSDLQDSRIYKRSGFAASISSLATTRTHTMRWSVLSDLSVADVSNISVIGLRVTIDQISNPSHYNVSQARLQSKAMAVSTTTVNPIDHEMYDEEARFDRSTHSSTGKTDLLLFRIQDRNCDIISGINLQDNTRSYAFPLIRCFPDDLERARLLGLVLTMNEVSSNRYYQPIVSAYHSHSRFSASPSRL